MTALPENNPNEDSVAADALPSRNEILFAPPRRAVVPLPVYKRKLLKALSSRFWAPFATWSVERFLAGVFFIFVFGVLGVFIADTLLCPEGTGVRFWEGCFYEVLGFGIGGGLFGLVAFVYLVRLLSLPPRKPRQS